MKTIAVFAFVCFSTMEMQAQDQIKQGVYSLGGSIYYSSKTYTSAGYDKTEESFIISPNAAYFVANQMELFINAAYSVVHLPFYTGPRTMCPYSEDQINLALGLGARYYFPLGSVAPFIGAGGQIFWAKPEYDSDLPFSPPQTGYTISGGLEIFIGQSAALEPIVTYSRTRLEAGRSIGGIYIGIGARYFIF